MSTSTVPTELLHDPQAWRKVRKAREGMSSDFYLRRYPRICASIITFSLGYATPMCAAMILKAAKEGRENWCEWIASCYRCDPRPAVRSAIRQGRKMRGYMGDFPRALAIVRHELETGEGPLLTSWF